MRDFNQLFEALDQRANGTIQVLDFAALAGQQATGEFLIFDHNLLILNAASGDITIDDYTLLSGITVTVDSVGYVEGVDWTAGTDNDTTATSLASAINGGANVGAAAVGSVVTVTASTPGSAGNAIDTTENASGVGITIPGATLINGRDHAVFNVNGTNYTQGTDFNAVTDIDTTAANLATAIDGQAGVSAGSSGGIVTITNDAVGTAGNSKVTTYTGDPGAATANQATLQGGTDPATITIGSDTITEGTDFNALTSDEVTATNIAAAIDLLASYSASADGDTVTVYQTAAGTAGNSTALTTSAAASEILLSGATLSGGVDESFSDVFDYDNVDDFDYLGLLTDITVLAAGGITITPQTSYDKVNFEDHHPLQELTSVDTVAHSIDDPKLYARLKIVVSQSPATFSVKMMTKEGVPPANGKGDGSKDIAITSTAVPLSATPLRVRSLTVQAKSANAGKIRIGGENIGNTDDGNSLNPESSKHYSAPVDLADVYINGAAADGVTYEYSY